MNTLIKNILLIPYKLLNRISIFTYINNCQFEKNIAISTRNKIYSTTIKEYSYLGKRNVVINTDIGKYCSIGSNCSIGLPSHPTNFVSTSPVFLKGKNILRKNIASIDFDPYEKKTIIENDVWIGNNVIIKQGIKICNGSVIGMGAVLTKDVGPYEVWGGNPAKLLKKRFDHSIEKKLIDSEWWDASTDILIECGQYINNPTEFLDALMKGED